jgi:hypothetical protein
VSGHLATTWLYGSAGSEVSIGYLPQNRLTAYINLTPGMTDNNVPNVDLVQRIGSAAEKSLLRVQ